jgi:RNA polymerase sigma-70 factor (ECF subfamily)
MADGSLAGRELSDLMQEMRPRLHRYCARMMGSAFEGEDVVQDALLRAMEALPGAGPIARPQSWLLKVAHNAALDALRRKGRRAERAEPDLDRLEDRSASADARVAASAGLAAFLQLPPGPRACAVLVDVLGHSIAEACEILEMTEPAVKAALHRARARLADIALDAEAPAARLDPAERARLRAYADRFNARDFDALRDLLAQDVRLDLVNRVRLAGKAEVSVYFTRYSESHDWAFSPGLAEGRPALLARDPGDPAGAVRYVVLIDWRNGRIAAIRDFRYATYVTDLLETGAAWP